MAEQEKAKTEVNKLEPIKGIRLGDSFVSLIIGAIVVVVVVILIFSLGKSRRIQDTSSIQDGPVIQKKEGKTDRIPLKTRETIYIVKTGDDLWQIAENLYKDGYKWTEIAKANNLQNPEVILVNDKLIIPDVNPSLIADDVGTPKPEQKQEVILKTRSITGGSYIVKTGDNLWNIAVRAYGDGFKWPDIATANNLENPNLIFEGSTVEIPR